MRKILVLFAHPAFERSRVNVQLAKAIRDLDAVTLHDLYEVYPDLDIDVRREQELLIAHDVVVLQHPFYWYSSPAILKEWQDLVLEHGWAYGSGGTRLHGKAMMNAITAGGKHEAYCAEGMNHYTVRQLLTPFEQTARLCGMTYLAPHVVYGTHQLSEDDIRRHADGYRNAILALRNGAELPR